MRTPHIPPALRDFGLILPIERLLEDQPDGKQAKRGLVGAALQLCIPLEMPRILCPSPKSQQQLVEIGAGLRAQTKSHGCPLDETLRGFRRAGHIQSKALQAQDLGRQIVRGKGRQAA